MPFETPIPIRQAIQNIVDGKYVLPAIQREFIWEPEQIELLFDSLLRGYPISSFLFWEVPRNQVKDWQFYKFLTHYHEYNARHNAPAQLMGDRDVTAVLDGQQRLTALVVALTGTYASRTKNKQRSNLAAYPVKKLHIDLLGLADDTDEQKFYAIRFLTPEEAAADTARFWVSFPELFLKIKNVTDVLMFMAMERISSSPQEKRDFAAQTLAKICESLNTIGNVNFFLEREADLDKVLQIFIRINSGGTKLSYSDLLLSIATASWKGTDARQAIHGFVDELNSVSDELTFDQDFVLKSALVLSDISDVLDPEHPRTRVLSADRARKVVPNVAQSKAATTRGYAISPIKGNSVTLLDSLTSTGINATSVITASMRLTPSPSIDVENRIASSCTRCEAPSTVRS
jgi:hypothetical protein